ncbi:MAG: hypothetical protein IIC46_04520 [Planctomycetes bacterium]|nr:hypothetical protein [Planctomycetota bacterium]
MKRHLFKLVLFLALGAIVNVAVAWGLAVSVDLSAAPISAEGVSSADPPAWSFVSYRRPGVWSIFAAAATREEDVRVGMFGSGLRAADSFFHHSYPYRQPIPEWLPTWSCVRRRPSARFPKIEMVIEEARGWPLLSLKYEKHWHGAVPYPADWGIELWRHRSAAWSSFAVVTLPLRPLWPGFAINTIFYSAVLVLLTLGPITARRMIRRKRGHCIKCGYDLRGTSGGDFSTGCPECGWGRESEA